MNKHIHRNASRIALSGAALILRESQQGSL